MDKNYWYEALKAGTIIGLVDCAFALLKTSLTEAGKDTLSSAVYFVGLLVFALLLYAFTKRMSAAADAQRGFTYGRCMGFVLAMMIFTGIIAGVYTAIMNNFVITDTLYEQIDTAFATIQDMIPDDQFDTMYSAYRKAMLNPFVLVVTSVFGYAIQGGIVGLITSAFAKRDPDIFADGDSMQQDNE